MDRLDFQRQYGKLIEGYGFKLATFPNGNLGYERLLDDESSHVVEFYPQGSGIGVSMYVRDANDSDVSCRKVDFDEAGKIISVS